MIGIATVPWVAGGAAALVLGGFVVGHMTANGSAERRALRATVAQLQADQKTALDIQLRMAQTAAELRERNEALRKEADDLETTFRNRPAPTCVLSDDDMRRLRNLAAGPQRRPAAAPRFRIGPPLQLPGAAP